MRVLTEAGRSATTFLLPEEVLTATIPAGLINKLGCYNLATPNMAKKWSRNQYLALGSGIIVPLLPAALGLYEHYDKPKKTPDLAPPAQQQQPTVPATPSETKPKVDPGSPSVAPIPNPKMPPVDKYPTNFVQDRGLEINREDLMAYNWKGTVDDGKTPGGIAVWYKFKEDGTVELQCQTDPDCRLPRGRWELKDDRIKITFFPSSVSNVAMHEDFIAKGVLKKDTIEGTSQFGGEATKRWQLTRQTPEFDVRGPKPKK